MRPGLSARVGSLSRCRAVGSLLPRQLTSEQGTVRGPVEIIFVSRRWQCQFMDAIGDGEQSKSIPLRQHARKHPCETVT